MDELAAVPVGTTRITIEVPGEKSLVFLAAEARFRLINPTRVVGRRVEDTGDLELYLAASMHGLHEWEVHSCPCGVCPLNKRKA